MAPQRDAKVPPLHPFQNFLLMGVYTMENRCVNFRLILLLCMFIPALMLTGFLLYSALIAVSADGICLFAVLFALSLASLAVCLMLEPVYYIINNDGALICSFFRKESYAWRDIMYVQTTYDHIFRFLFHTNYTLVCKKEDKHHRMNSILKCKKATELLKQYCWRPVH